MPNGLVGLNGTNGVLERWKTLGREPLLDLLFFAGSVAATGNDVFTMFVATGVGVWLGPGCIVCTVWVVTPYPWSGCSPVGAGALDMDWICTTCSI